MEELVNKKSNLLEQIMSLTSLAFHHATSNAWSACERALDQRRQVYEALNALDAKLSGRSFPQDAEWVKQLETIRLRDVEISTLLTKLRDHLSSEDAHLQKMRCELLERESIPTKGTRLTAKG